MSIARTCIKGIVYLNSRVSVPGFNLFTPVKDQAAYLIDARGAEIHKWALPYKPATGAQLLPNGNLLYMGIDPDSPVSSIEGAGGILQELDKSGRVVREYRDPMMHHEPIRLVNGNYLVMKWVPLDNSFSARVKGGSHYEGPMYEDSICEIDYRGNVVWEWLTSSYLSPEEISRCPVCPRDTWIHMNGITEMKNGNVMVSFAKANQIAVIDKVSKKIIWNWDSKGEISHQHCPVELKNGNIMIFDNGLHPYKYSTDFSRVIKLNPASKKVVWAYSGAAGNRLAAYFDSPLYSSCQELENGNIVICEGISGRLFEITPSGELCWEYVNPYPVPLEGETTRSKPVYTVLRYIKEYPGLEGFKF